MSDFFLEPKSFGSRVNIELDFSNYASKSDLKNATTVGTSNFSNKFDLASLQSNVDKSNIDKLKNVPSDLIKLEIRNLNKLDVDKLVHVLVYFRKLGDVVRLIQC